MEYLTLSNGFNLPMIGFGTLGQIGEQAIKNTAFALQNGYRLIDTANRYNNEADVAEGLRRSGLAREEYFVETKLGPTLYSKDSAIDDTLERMGLDYIDIFLLHHPVNDYMHAYRMLEKAYMQGKIRAIGVCNFTVEQLEHLIDEADIPPLLTQIECHPYYPAEKLAPFCQKNGIGIQSWYPLGHGNSDMLSNPVIGILADLYHKTPAQIILRWHTQMGFAAVPGSTSKEHIKENADIFDFVLSPGDMALMASVNQHTPFYTVTEESLHRLATTRCSFEK